MGVVATTRKPIMGHNHAFKSIALKKKGLQTTCSKRTQITQVHSTQAQHSTHKNKAGYSIEQRGHYRLHYTAAGQSHFQPPAALCGSFSCPSKCTETSDSSLLFTQRLKCKPAVPVGTFTCTFKLRLGCD